MTYLREEFNDKISFTRRTFHESLSKVSQI
jgi:hypothetical protein